MYFISVGHEILNTINVGNRLTSRQTGSDSINRTDLCRRLPASGYAFNLDLPVFGRPQFSSIDNDRSLGGHVDRKGSIPRSDGQNTVCGADLALKRSVVFELNGVNIQGVVA